MEYDFRQVDVFTSVPYLGNPVAVVHDAETVDEEKLQLFARWTNLSETTFLLPPTTSQADYRLRIFTPGRELPFAGHPTLGSAHAWLEAGGEPKESERIVQECDAGLIDLQRTEGGLAFSAPPLVRSGPVDGRLLEEITRKLGADPATVVAAEWVDNGPGWIGLLFEDAETVLALRPRQLDRDVGVIGPYPSGSPQQFEVRAFFQVGSSTVEDPVTGSLNASLAQWLLRTRRATAPYLVRQGSVLERAGEVRVSQGADGTIWIGGDSVTCIVGTVWL